MHPRVADLVDYLTRERAALLGAVASVPSDHLDRQPAPGAWSVGELLDHLHQIEAGSARLLAGRLAKAREAGLGPETSSESVLQCLADFPIREGPPREAPEMVRPRPGTRAEDAMAGLQASREMLLEVLREGDGLDLGSVTAHHRVLGDIGIYAWCVFIGQHEERHERQIRAIGEALRNAPTVDAAHS
jgi:hypothetical protein